jgi:hypothetical protein
MLGHAGCNHCTTKLFVRCNTRNFLWEKVTDLPLDAQLWKLDVVHRGSALLFHKQLLCPAPANSSSWVSHVQCLYGIRMYKRTTEQWTTRFKACPIWEWQWVAARIGNSYLSLHLYSPLRWIQHLRPKQAISQHPLRSNPSGHLSFKCVIL